MERPASRSNHNVFMSLGSKCQADRFLPAKKQVQSLSERKKIRWKTNMKTKSSFHFCPGCLLSAKAAVLLFTPLTLETRMQPAPMTYKVADKPRADLHVTGHKWKQVNIEAFPYTKCFTVVFQSLIYPGKIKKLTQRSKCTGWNTAHTILYQIIIK